MVSSEKGCVHDRTSPLDLVALLGSYNEEANIEGKFETESMQSARFESGLDNSPM